MSRLAQDSVFNTAVLVAGDRDLAEAVRAIQGIGRRVVILQPQGSEVARELRQLPDMLQLIDSEMLEQFSTLSDRG